MYYIYILENPEGKHYIGYTSKNPEVRAREHNRAKVKWTRSKGPWNLIYSEEFSARKDAFIREKQLKSFKGGRALKELVEKRGDGRAG